MIRWRTRHRRKHPRPRKAKRIRPVIFKTVLIHPVRIPSARDFKVVGTAEFTDYRRADPLADMKHSMPAIEALVWYDEAAGGTLNTPEWEAFVAAWKERHADHTDD